MVAIAGVAGNGQGELFRRYFRREPVPAPDAVAIDGHAGRPLRHHRPAALRRRLRARGTTRPWRRARPQLSRQCRPDRATAPPTNWVAGIGALAESAEDRE